MDAMGVLDALGLENSIWSSDNILAGGENLLLHQASKSNTNTLNVLQFPP